MKHIFINNYRRKVKRKSIFQTSDLQTQFNGINNASVNMGEIDIAIADITGEIDRLSDLYKTPFLMHYQGYKYHEIAEHLTLPIGTIKSRINYARSELKRKLKRV